MKSLLILFFILFSLTSSAQNDLSNYLKSHYYTFTLDKGFDSFTTDALKLKFAKYRLILEAEGGSHSLNIYHKLPIMWIEFLNENFELKYFFIESGPDAAYLGDRYLQTGDSSHLNNGWKNYWRPYYKLNSKLDASKKIIPVGIDFNRPANYVKALKLLLSKSLPNELIKNDIELIKNANDTLNNCDYILGLLIGA